MLLRLHVTKNAGSNANRRYEAVWFVAAIAVAGVRVFGGAHEGLTVTTVGTRRAGLWFTLAV